MTARSTPERFAAFHAANPHVYAELVRLAREAHAQGGRKIGMRMLWEVMRWNQRRYLHTTGESSEYRLNDHYPPYYARLIMVDHPELDGLFETRGGAELPDAILRTVQQHAAMSATEPPAPGPADVDAGVLFDMPPDFDAVCPPRHAINDGAEAA